MESIKVKVRVAVIAIFLAGFAGGVLAARLYYADKVRATSPKPRPGISKEQEVLDSYSRTVNMTPEQREQAARILAETTGQYERLKSETRPRFDEIRNNARARIRALLTPEQQAKFDELVRQRDAARQLHHKDNK